jgi:hypothetical protein
MITANAVLNALANVRYWAKSGHGADLSVRPLMTQSGHGPNSHCNEAAVATNGYSAIVWRGFWSVLE